MTKEEQAAYRRHLDDAVIMRDVITTAWEESRFMGHAEGHAEGLAEGLAEGRAETARKMKADNMPVELISKYTGLMAEEIEQL